MNLVITGGLGLIGYDIAKAAVAAGHHVRVIDDMRAAVTSWRPAEFSLDVVSVENADPHHYTGADAVIHCAAPVGPVGILQGNTLRDMTSANEAAIRIARHTGARLIVMSSSEVYGATVPDPLSLIVPGEWSPRSEYAVGKIVTELMARRHHAETGQPTCVIRPWNVTGPLQTAGKGFVFPRFAEAVVTGRGPTVYLPGDQRRSFMAASDVAALTVALLHGDNHWDGVPVDIATPGNAASVMELAEMFVHHPLSRAAAVDVVDPQVEHGPTFREAACGSKLPPPTPALAGWTGLGDMVDAAVRHAALAVERVAA